MNDNRKSFKRENYEFMFRGRLSCVSALLSSLSYSSNKPGFINRVSKTQGVFDRGVLEVLPLGSANKVSVLDGLIIERGFMKYEKAI